MDADTKVRRLLDPYFARLGEAGHLIGPAKEAPFDPEDGGVPPAMFDGEPSDGGWVRWKVIPSRVTLPEIERLEAVAGGPFPPLFRAFLRYGHLMSLECAGVRLPALASDNALGDLSSTLTSWTPLIAAGYVAFGDDLNDTGAICFDYKRRLPSKDCPVVLFDHEAVINLGETAAGRRELVERYAHDVAPSFESLLERIVSTARPN